jgi:site-specific recombinase XerD
MRHQLPPVAAHYVAVFPYDKSNVRHLVGRFHAWLKANRVSTSEITINHVNQFTQQPWAQDLADSTQTLYNKHLQRYVRWLADGGYTARVRKEPAAPPLPKTAHDFILELKTTLSRGTTKNHEQFLRRWYRWTDSKNIDTHKLTRDDIVAFSRMLHTRGIAPQSRRHYLAQLRRYLFYLSDRGLLSEHPTNLVRAADFPKQPSLLPRALAPHVDAELRARLAAAPHVRCRGLLLMRHTGLRVSELANLRMDCMHEDHQGCLYLKVPLGKMKKERLVPLNDEATSLVLQLQQQGRAGRTWLIENPRTKKPFSRARYQESLRSLRSGLPNEDGLAITTHRLRHSFATELLSAGLGLAAIRQLLGHRSLNMTLRYVSLTPNQLRDEYLAANAKARQQYGKVPEAPRTDDPIDETTSAAALADIIRKVKRDAATLALEHKPQARRAVRQLNNIAILLNELGL